MFDLIIIGGGAASQSAAMYAIGKQLNFLMIYENLGGRAGKVALADHDYLVGNIMVHFDFPDAQDDESLLIGSSAIHLFERQIKYHRGNILQDRVTTVSKVEDVFHVETMQNGVQQGRTVIVSTGVSPRRLAVTGGNEQLVRDFGYNVTLHASSESGKTVAVIGSTERALYGAAEMAQTARNVYLLVPGAFLPTTPIVQVLRQRQNVKIFEACEVKGIAGETSLEELVIEHQGQTLPLNVDIAFADMGVQPNIGMVQHLVEIESNGFIRVDSQNATSTPGMFAAGDVTKPFGDQVLIAIGEGARAALSVHHYLLERSLPRQIGG